MAENTNNTERHSTPLIRTYACLVRVKRRTIDQVPEKYRQDVQDYLNGLIE